MAVGRITKSFKIAYHKTVSSIAFYPAIIAIGFLVFSWLMLELDFSAAGKHIKSNYSWVRLKDASTARTIVSTIAGGIISLMVFSFSMVMILLNQAASQMSNRMLESMIGNRFQQYVLGMYIGTIVYSLFLLSTIRDIESGIYVPALSIYLLLLITVADIFIFIYFLHYVTQSVKFETIIDRVHKQTIKSLQHSLVKKTKTEIQPAYPSFGFQVVCTQSSGYFQGFDKKSLLDFTKQNNLLVEFLHAPGTFLIRGQDFIKIHAEKILKDSDIDDLLVTMDFYHGQPVAQNYYYGFHQLTEVALKALSPGINDPETAVLSLNALSDLFHYRLHHEHDPLIFDDTKTLRIVLCFRNFQELFTECITPIWNYGKEDLYIQNTFRQMITQLERSELSTSDGKYLAAFRVKTDDINSQR